MLTSGVLTTVAIGFGIMKITSSLKGRQFIAPLEDFGHHCLDKVLKTVSKS
jgi:hypothetical protein